MDTTEELKRMLALMLEKLEDKAKVCDGSSALLWARSKVHTADGREDACMAARSMSSMHAERARLVRECKEVLVECLDVHLTRMWALGDKTVEEALDTHRT